MIVVRGGLMIKTLYEYASKDENSPCHDCIVFAICTKSFLDNTMCDKLKKYLFDKLMEERKKGANKK